MKEISAAKTHLDNIETLLFNLLRFSQPPGWLELVGVGRRMGEEMDRAIDEAQEKNRRMRKGEMGRFGETENATPQRDV